jgi:hypothetical protein
MVEGSCIPVCIPFTLRPLRSPGPFHKFAFHKFARVPQTEETLLSWADSLLSRPELRCVLCLMVRPTLLSRLVAMLQRRAWAVPLAFAVLLLVPTGEAFLMPQSSSLSRSAAPTKSQASPTALHGKQSTDVM